MSGRIRGRGGAIAVLVLLIVGLAVGSVATATTIYVDEKAAGKNDGTSWTKAYTNLQTALVAAASGDEIRVAKGVYYPGTTQTSSFTLKDGVALYGGYPTGGGTRDVANNVTVLSGDIGKDDTTDANGVTTTINGNNAYHVVKSSNNDSSAVLDGFTITGGNADGSVTDSLGGGMYNDNSSPTVTGCTFSGNTAYYGGGMYNHYYSPTLTGCTFSGNTAADYGGGMYNGDSSPMVTNCTFSGNTASANGGGMYNYYSSPTLTNCTFSGNTASANGGGMYNHFGSLPTVRNTILWGDRAPSGPEINGPTTVEYCVVEGGYTGGTDIITADPLLGTLGDYGGSTETIPLLPGSSAIDSANSDYAPAIDQRGVWRPQGPASDIGAFESQGFTFAIVGGNNQATAINTAFPTPLAVSVTSAHSEPVDGATVTFTAPSSGASATFDTNPVSISSGEASVTATANGIIGTYHVTATSVGVGNTASFDLNNGVAEMDVQGGNPLVSIVDGDTTPSTGDGTDFGGTPIAGGTVDHTFTIKNSGPGNLNLTGTPKMSIGGTHAADFSVTSQPTSSLVSGGGTTTFTVRFDPSAVGTRSATISIANNDANENPYNFSIQGTGVDKGDLDGDGTVNVLDARLCLQIAEGVIPGTAAQRQQADVDGDGDVDLTDAQLLAEYIIGIRTALPGGG